MVQKRSDSFIVLKLVLLIASLILLSLPVQAASTYCSTLPAQNKGALGNPTGKTLGGGVGYGAWVAEPDDGGIDNRVDLQNALGAAQAGDTIYLKDDAEIDLTGIWETEIRSGVTLASGRGRNGSLGALLYTSDDRMAGNKALLRVVGDNVRITGLRIRGPITDRLPAEADGELYDSRGIRVMGNNAEIDNNDIWNFARNGVLLSASRRIDFAHVHHNYIHHTSRQLYHEDCDRRTKAMPGAYLCGISYGVSVGDTNRALIEANVFSHHRHAINGGSPGTNYEARYNLVLSTFYSHPFDMHEFCPLGNKKNCSAECLWPGQDCGFFSGESARIHQNTFLNTQHPAVAIRGKPQGSAHIYCNRFARSTTVSVEQRLVPESAQLRPAGNTAAHDNTGHSLVEPFTVIRSNACCGFTGKYLGVEPSTGTVKIFDRFSSAKTRWRVIWDNDVMRIQSLVYGNHYGKYLDISTTSGSIGLFAQATHTGTKWSKELYRDSSGEYSRIVSRSSGNYQGTYLTVSLNTGNLFSYWNPSYSGTDWLLQHQQ